MRYIRPGGCKPHSLVFPMTEGRNHFLIKLPPHRERFDNQDGDSDRMLSVKWRDIKKTVLEGHPFYSAVWYSEDDYISRKKRVITVFLLVIVSLQLAMLEPLYRESRTTFCRMQRECHSDCTMTSNGTCSQLVISSFSTTSKSCTLNNSMYTVCCR